MLRAAANISDGFMLSEIEDMSRRYQAASQMGFDAVECAFPYHYALTSLQAGKSSTTNEMHHILINSFPGNAGELGLACNPNRFGEFRQSFMEKTLVYATSLGCSFVHIMAGKLPLNSSWEQCRKTFEENLLFATDQLAQKNITALIEPLNSRVSNPNYFLDDFDMATDIIRSVDHPNLKLQFDFFHCHQQYESPVLKIWDRCLPYVGHVQVSQAPSRDEPWGEGGAINYKEVYETLVNSSYDGYVGFEYKPATNTVAGLDAFRGYDYSKYFNLN